MTIDFSQPPSQEIIIWSIVFLIMVFLAGVILVKFFENKNKKS